MVEEGAKEKVEDVEVVQSTIEVVTEAVVKVVQEELGREWKNM